ncbi:unnamed protein product [Phytophthora fragariaefolia]|uniref:Unnamed protein product n=1 Tax=Phytophthora fragariaefolia TaxID=1490495 RepID=A0A9W6XLL8_9STRA|nr:unnamed protein product [Phytophthora fragariaefolia]
MAEENKSDFSELKFNGKASDFQRWKDTVSAHLTQMTNRRRLTEIQAGRSAPTLGVGLPGFANKSGYYPGYWYDGGHTHNS